MSAQNPSSIAEWAANLPIPWLVAGPNGAADVKAWATVVDQQIALTKQAAKVAMPGQAPVDALPHIGADRQLIQGAGESDASFRIRLRDAWAQWSRAGTWCSVLEQLWYFGATNAVIVQPNGLAYSFSGAPTPGQDPTALVSISNTSATTSTLTSTAPPYRTIPAGTPWFAFDGNTDMTNRFAVILPSWPFATQAVATFSGTDTATVAWSPFGFPSTTYNVIIRPPSDNVVLSANTLTTTGCTISASAPWTGSVYVTAFVNGVNPLNVFSNSSYGALQKVISTFRPNAICMGVKLFQSGRMWGYPASNTYGDGGTWGGSVAQILGQF